MTTSPSNPTIDAAPADPSEPRLLLVLGMHRSGTSVVTDLLGRLGFELGHDLLPPREDNPNGFFENARVVEIHERLLRALDRTWDDPRPLPDGWIESDHAARARESLRVELAALLAGSERVAVKDPRTSRLVPLWRQVAESMSIGVAALIVHRHPAEVARSLARRDRLDVELSALLWSAHTLDAERDTRGLTRATLDFDALCSDWEGSLRRCLAALGVAATETTLQSLRGVVDPEQRHHLADRAARKQSFAESIALRLHAALAATRDAEAAALIAETERARAGFNVLLQGYAIGQSVLRREMDALDEQRARAEYVATEAMRVGTSALLTQPDTSVRPTSLPRVYVAAEDGAYSESSAQDGTVESSAPAGRVVFQIAADAAPARLRFDPASLPGIYVVRALRIEGVQVVDFAARVVAVSERRLPPQEEGTVRFAASGDDPWIDLRLDGLELPPIESGLLTVLIDHHCERVFDGFEQALDRIVASGVRAELARLDQSIVQMREQHEAQRVELSQRVAATEQHLRNESEQARAGLQTTGASLDRVEARVATLESTLLNESQVLSGRIAGVSEQSRELRELIESLEHGRQDRTLVGRLRRLRRALRRPAQDGKSEA